jgi:outer membrane protein insertion porin family
LTPTDGSGTAIGGTYIRNLPSNCATHYLKSFGNDLFIGVSEAGNCWINAKSYKPFDLYRSAGFGARIHLPMFGMFGLDWGYGFDEIPGSPTSSGSQFHFSINQSID